MDKLILVQPTEADAEKLEAYRAEFPAGRLQVTADPDRIPGMDGMEEFESVSDWISYMKTMEGKISWYMTVREKDRKVVGMIAMRHSLEYDDDDEDFASHIGYSIRPSEQRKGYAKEQLRLCLQKAKEAGLETVRLVCRDINIGSGKTILANGGVYLDSIYGEESGLTIDRYDIRLS